MSEANARPRMCPSCGKLMGIARECPYCGADAGAIGTRLKALGRAATAQGDGRGMSVTVGLLVVMTAIYLASIAFGGVEENHGMMLLSPTQDTQIRLGSMWVPLVHAGEWWRIVTGNFLHWGVLHLLSNGLAIYVMGKAYEDEVGPAALFGLFMLAGIGGFALSYAVGPEMRNVAGASAGGFGLIGAVIGRRRLVDGHFRDRRTFQAIEIAVINMIFGLAVGADNYAHFGGLIIGAVVAYLQARFERARVAWLVVALLMAVVTVGAGALALTHPTVSLHAIDEASACRRLAIDALDATSQAPDVDRSERALACFARLPSVGDEADGHLQAMAKSLRRALDGRQRGSYADERAGVAGLYEAAHGFDLWWTGYVRSLGLDK